MFESHAALLVDASCLSFAIGLAVGAGVVIAGGSTGCVALALPLSLSLATISSLKETLRIT